MYPMMHFYGCQVFIVCILHIFVYYVHIKHVRHSAGGHGDRQVPVSWTSTSRESTELYSKYRQTKTRKLIDFDESCKNKNQKSNNRVMIEISGSTSFG